MSNEIRVQSSLQVRKGELDYSSRPTSFNANMAGSRGPTPGMVMCSPTGTDIDLTQLAVLGGVCRIQNLDPTNYIECGPYDPNVTTYLPFIELLPGESYPLRLSRFLGSEMGNVPGTGTTGSSVRLRIKGVGGTCPVLVEAFDA